MGGSLLIRNTRGFRVTEVRLRTCQHGLAICAEMQNIPADARIA
jgi:DNA-binding transcriptional LysR family regulator